MAPETKVRQHQWVKFKITPVSVLEGLNGEPVIIVDPDKDQAADEQTQYGCMSCLTHLDADNMKTECPGESE
jgi:hypothetical protein